MVPNLKRHLWISFSIIVASIIVAVVGFYLLMGDITTVSAKILSDKISVGEQTGALGVVAQLKEQAPQAATYQAAMDALLPTQDGLIGFSQWLSGIAEQYQVSASVSFSNTTVPAADSAAGYTAFSLSATGDLNDLAAFLTDIESKSPGFLLQITSFDLTSQGGTYQFTGQGNLFFR